MEDCKHENEDKEQKDQKDHDRTIELKLSEARICTKCRRLHRCQRCTKGTHICCSCGQITHDCDICGAVLDSISAIKKHQEESKICKKARMLTATTYLEQLKKVGGVVTNMSKHGRTRSVPEICIREEDMVTY